MAKRAKVTPLMTSKGLFKVSKPFLVNEKKVYEVVAIREFDDLWSESIDVYGRYYQPFEISEEDYRLDAQMGAAIVSLQGEEGILHIPDTYILSYPEAGLANYQHVVLSISLGAVPKSLSLEDIRNEISEMCSKFTGVKNRVAIHTAPVTEALTIKEADNLEKIRKGNQQTSDSSYMRAVDMQRQRDAVVKNTNNRLLKKLGK